MIKRSNNKKRHEEKNMHSAKGLITEPMNSTINQLLIYFKDVFGSTKSWWQDLLGRARGGLGTEGGEGPARARENAATNSLLIQIIDGIAD